jgi:gliding motility-associated-like protein
VPPLPKNAGGRNYAGCDPYALNFITATEYADRWYWDLGDGSSSYEREPSVIYDNPGQYIVTLYAWGPGSLVDSVFIRHDTVNVFPTPVADFLVEPDTVMLPNQAVYCYNRSINGDLYEWSFGDNGNEVFIEENPIHYYTKSGTYNITLRVYTQTDPSCFNSKTINAAIVVEDPGVCKFPSAFSPNSGGPSDGRWLATDVSNDIFHPLHRGVHEYKLEIFNRWGEKVFESKDPAIGWDGYRDGKLLTQDVYVWKVTGKYRNGVIFKDAGDVTLVR